MSKMILNPDIEYRKIVLDKLRENKGYCPCSIVKNEHTRCMCTEMRELNICHCGLYVKGGE